MMKAATSNNPVASLIYKEMHPDGPKCSLDLHSQALDEAGIHNSIIITHLLQKAAHDARLGIVGGNGAIHEQLQSFAESAISTEESDLDYSNIEKFDKKNYPKLAGAVAKKILFEDSGNGELGNELYYKRLINGLERMAQIIDTKNGTMPDIREISPETAKTVVSFVQRLMILRSVINIRAKDVTIAQTEEERRLWLQNPVDPNGLRQHWNDCTGIVSFRSLLNTRELQFGLNKQTKRILTIHGGEGSTILQEEKYLQQFSDLLIGGGGPDQSIMAIPHVDNAPRKTEGPAQPFVYPESNVLGVLKKILEEDPSAAGSGLFWKTLWEKPKLSDSSIPQYMKQVYEPGTYDVAIIEDGPVAAAIQYKLLLDINDQSSELARLMLGLRSPSAGLDKDQNEIIKQLMQKGFLRKTVGAKSKESIAPASQGWQAVIQCLYGKTILGPTLPSAPFEGVFWDGKDITQKRISTDEQGEQLATIARTQNRSLIEVYLDYLRAKMGYYILHQNENEQMTGYLEKYRAMVAGGMMAAITKNDPHLTQQLLHILPLQDPLIQEFTNKGISLSP